MERNDIETKIEKIKLRAFIPLFKQSLYEKRENSNKIKIRNDKIPSYYKGL